jgi:RNA polymerase sigma-70 factor (ECF subfamily)
MKQEIYSDIIKRMRNGDETAVSELVNKTMNLALHITCNILYNKSDLEDTIQDIYLRMWENLDSYDETKGKFVAWFASIVRNQCIDRNKKIRINPDHNIPLYEPDKNPSIEEEIQMADLRNEILKISDELPEKQKEIFILRDVQNLPIKDVQELTGLSSGSIKTNLYLARKRIKELLDPEWYKL